MKDRIKLNIVVDQAAYFLEWEMKYFLQVFEIVREPSDNAVVLAFGPDVFERVASMPALKRVAVLFPGFYFNPYHDLDAREKAFELIKTSYDLIFVNPGPIQEALKATGKTVSHPFSVDVDKILEFRRDRTSIDSLLHVSAESPQKDWERSRDVMDLTGLENEVFPPRAPTKRHSLKDRLSWRYNKYITARLNSVKAFRKQIGYVDHSQVIRKYADFDGFLHIAAEKPSKLHIDGKYTAALLEAGVTGSIVFWHDTLGLGNDFETIFSLPKEPSLAASEILTIRKSLDVAKHSRLTSDEIADRCHPRKIVSMRLTAIENVL